MNEESPAFRRGGVNRDEATPGARVTWADDELTGLEFGVIVKPTSDELDYCATYPHAVGPAADDVLVEWNGGDWDRAWHKPEDLQLAARGVPA